MGMIGATLDLILRCKIRNNYDKKRLEKEKEIKGKVENGVKE